MLPEPATQASEYPNLFQPDQLSAGSQASAAADQTSASHTGIGSFSGTTGKEGHGQPLSTGPTPLPDLRGVAQVVANPLSPGFRPLLATQTQLDNVLGVSLEY